jgi:hypothetical protein
MRGEILGGVVAGLSTGVETRRASDEMALRLSKLEAEKELMGGAVESFAKAQEEADKLVEEKQIENDALRKYLSERARELA